MQTYPVEFFEFIKNNYTRSPLDLRLKYKGNNEAFDSSFAIDQIESRRKFSKKLKGYVENPEFLFPTVLSGEQASHECVAKYHATLSGENGNILDMTAGLGIDAMEAARKAACVTAIELDSLKSEILTHNTKVCGLDNITVLCDDSIRWLNENKETMFDLIFTDPARRGEGNKRLYNFHDCEPDIIKILPLLKKRSKRILIKASPLIDVSQTLSDITGVSSLRAVCIDGECKEILVGIDNTLMESPTIFEAINLSSNGTVISSFVFHEEKTSSSEIIYATLADLKPGNWLYEPDAGMMKLAPWSQLCSRYNNIRKLDVLSHLFTSDQHLPDFPGRILEITRIPDKKDRKSLKGSPINVAVRNYPTSASELRKKLGVTEGSDTFIYGTRISGKPLLIECVRNGIRH